LKNLKNSIEADTNGHGTAMASIIRDVAPQANVVAIRISDGFPRMWKLMEGISAASFQHQADIINISCGLDNIPTACPKCGLASPGLSTNMQYFLEDISQKEVGIHGPPLLLASTGNNARSNGYCYPAFWNFTIAVGSINSTIARSRFSNYWISSSHPAFVVMPGGDEDSSSNATEWVGEGNDAKCIGTSPATAYASAMLALYLSDPNYHQPDREKFLQQVLANCDDTFSGYDRDEHGEGFLPYAAFVERT
jgi:hypothetical protein